MGKNNKVMAVNGGEKRGELSQQAKICLNLINDEWNTARRNVPIAIAIFHSV